MAHPVVHFEVIGKQPARLRDFYSKLFGWTFDTSGPVAEAISEAGNYGFVDRIEAGGGSGIPGGVGGGAGYQPHAIFYVGVPDIDEMLRKAEQAGGKCVLGPTPNPGTNLVVAHLADPEGNLIGLASVAG